MKKIIYSLFALAMLITVSSCKKTGADANVFSSVTNFGTGAYLTLDSTINVNFNSTALATSQIGIEVSQAPAGSAIQSIVLFASTSSGYDTTQWSKIKTIPYTGPKTKITTTGQELANAFKIPLDSLNHPGSHFSFFTRVITKTGQYYDASNTGNDAGTGLVTGSTYNSAFAFTAFITCPFVGTVGGTYKVVEDTWVDWSQNALVNVTDGPGANQVNLSQVYPGPPDGGVSTNKFIVNVDPATGTAYVPTEDIGNYGSLPDFTVTGVGGATDAKLGTQCGYVFACTGYIGITVDFKTTTGSDYGPQTLILQLVSKSSETGLETNNVKMTRKKF